MWLDIYRPNTYLIEMSLAELDRLTFQHHMLTQATTNMMPREVSIERMRTVLDVGCGAGGWVLDVASIYPHLAVMGVDLESLALDYAAQQARSRGVMNVSFQQMDITKRLPLPTNSFDLVNARFLNNFLLCESWLPVLRELLRVTRPGGIICLTELDRWGRTTSAPYAYMENLILQAIGDDPRGRYVDIVPLLARMLHEVGVSRLQDEIHSINFSYGTECSRYQRRNLSMQFKLLKPFLLTMQVETAGRLDELYEQVIDSLYLERFCGMSFLYSIWGRKRGYEQEGGSHW